ncbi:MAG: LptF/LptG family permease, partial [Muribaculaceae bacterium]|nr:LptF/LptG family permease [Muribaculaceae bacterium]
LQRFLPLFAMTFFICLFIVLMQFLFSYVDDLVGKGLSMDVIGELFFYAALTMVPTALPLAVLLASLMTFGNLGEKFELTAMKAAGISLFRIMRPLIVLMVLVAMGAFFFQNNVLPVAQAKMWTLLFSVRQKSPEVEIPERSFYDQIPGINLYVDRKDPDTGMLYDVTIYDVSQGLDNSRVILADSARLSFTEDKTRLFLHFYSGEMFENLRNNSMGLPSSGYLPFRRENFSDKQVYFTFDANFNRMDESNMRSQYVGKNIAQLRHSIDSIGRKVDSLGNSFADELLARPFAGVNPVVALTEGDSATEVRRMPVAMAAPIDIDSIFNAPDASRAKSYVATAIATAKRLRQDYEFRQVILTDQEKSLRRHGIEMHKKFTLSIACIIFFFIGAPLGAIIKKGGLGTPLVISVILFIVYYIFDNAGYKMARDGKLEVWEGIWLSTAVLLPLGVFFTYKAVGDSAVFNFDAYRNFFRSIAGRQDKRSLEVKEVIMEDVQPERAGELVSALSEAIAVAMSQYKAMNPVLRCFVKSPLRPVQQTMSVMIDYLSNSRNTAVIERLNRYPFKVTRRSLAAMADASAELTRIISTNDNSFILNTESQDEPENQTRQD